MSSKRLQAHCRAFVRSIAISFCLSTAPADSQTSIWGANAGTAGQPNGSGQWLGTNQWWDGSSNTGWNNSGSAIAQMGATGSTLVSPKALTSGTVNAAGISFMGLSAAPGTGQQYTIAGSSGILNLGTGGVIHTADLSSTGSISSPFKALSRFQETASRSRNRAARRNSSCVLTCSPTQTSPER